LDLGSKRVLFPKKPASAAQVVPNAAGVAGTPFDCRVVPEKRLVTVKFGNTLTEREIAIYAASLRANPLFDPKFSEIVDLRDVEKLDLHGEQMLKLADKVDPFSFDSKRAFVVGNRTQSHAARMHQILRTSNENIRIFNSLPEAERWIES
jgi:hypothetical protein